jgi:hypothetical protein
MEGIDLLRKKTGMTIGMALMLMFGSMFFIFMLAGIYGGINGYTQEKLDQQAAIDLTLVAMLISFCVFSVIGFYVNKKELFHTKKPDIYIVFMGFLIGILWSLVSTIFADYYNIDKRVTAGMSNTWWFSFLTNCLFVLLQIGIIGHGLLRNYDFKKTLFTSSFLCVSLFLPAAVISMVFQTGILLFIYYRTASFYFVVLISIIMFSPFYIFKSLYGFQNISYNYLRLEVFKNDTVYYGFWLACIIALIFCLYLVYKNTKEIAWLRETEYVDLDR